MIETMREIVLAYDKIEAKKDALKAKTKALVKGGNVMKFKNMLAVIIGGIILVGAAVAAICIFTKKAGSCCCKKKKQDDEELYDYFPEEEIITDADEPVAEEPVSEEPAPEEKPAE